MTVGDIMTRVVVTVSMDDRLSRVRALFDRYRFHHLLVMEGSRLKGVVSDRDLLKHLSPFVGQLAERAQDTETLQRRVHQIMTRRPVTVRPEMPVGYAAALLLNCRVSCLPVVNKKGRPVGIVSWRDLLRAVFDLTGESQTLPPELSFPPPPELDEHVTTPPPAERLFP